METLTFRQYARAITRHWWLIAALMAIAVGGAYYRFGSLTPEYQAMTTLMMTPSAFAPSLTGAAGAAGAAAYPTSSVAVADNMRMLMATRVMGERVARRLDRSDAAEVQRAVAVSLEAGTDLIRVRATAPAPQAAADLANTAADELITYVQEINSRSARQARQFIERELQQVREQLESVERELLTARQDPPAAAGATDVVVSAYYAALSALDDARAGLRETEERLAQATVRLRSEDPVIVAELARIDNPIYRGIQTQLVALEVQQIQLSEIYTPQHPRMQELGREIAQLSNRLRSEPMLQVGREVRTSNPVHDRLAMDIVGLQADRIGAAARVNALEQVLQIRRARVSAIAPVQLSVTRLGRDREILEARYRILASQHQDAILRENLAATFPAGLTVVEPAAAPPYPQSASFPRAASAAGALGLVLGVIAAVVAQALDDRIQTPEDAEQVLGVPVLAQVPDAAPSRTVAASAVVAISLLILVGVATATYFAAHPVPIAALSPSGAAAPVIAPPADRHRR